MRRRVFQLRARQAASDVELAAGGVSGGRRSAADGGRLHAENGVPPEVLINFPLRNLGPGDPMLKSSAPFAASRYEQAYLGMQYAFQGMSRQWDGRQT